MRHEGEETLPELCAALKHRRELSGVRGLAFRRGEELVVTRPRPLCADLDALPFPARPGTQPSHLGIPIAFLVGSRGCHGHCTFCCINAWITEAGGPRYRERSVENLVDEIELLRRERGVRLFIFHDDDFFTRDRSRDLSRVTALRDGLRRRGLEDLALVVKRAPTRRRRGLPRSVRDRPAARVPRHRDRLEPGAAHAGAGGAPGPQPLRPAATARPRALRLLQPAALRPRLHAGLAGAKPALSCGRPPRYR